MKKRWLFILTMATSLLRAPLAYANEWQTLRTALEIDRCDRTTEVSYRSPVLRSPTGNTTVYTESVYRKQGVRGGLQSIGITCQDQNSQLVEPETPSQRIVIQTGSNSRVINLEAIDYAYGILTPLSFSPDGKYLVFHDAHNLSSGGILESPLVLNTQGNNQLFRPSCNTDHCHFDGFTSNTQFLLKAGPRNGPILVNAQTQSQQEIRTSRGGTNYGTTVSSGQVTKVQHLPLPGQGGRVGQQPEPLSVNSPLTLTGVGPIQIGMTVAEAQQAAGTQLIRGFNYQGCSIYSPAALDYIGLMVINNRIVRVSTLSNRLSTLSGAKVGDSKTRILELYPNNVRVTGVTISGRGEVLTYFPDDTSYSNYRMIFETNFSGQVTTIRSGQLPQVEYSEGCV